MISGVALIRVSTAAQADESKAGIPAQREAIRRICETHHIQVLPDHHFELTDISGASVLYSPDYQRFLRVVERPEISAVVTKEFTRLMRPERFDEYAILQHFVDHGVTLYLPDAVMDLSNRQDRFFAGLKAGMAGMERHDIRQRMMDGKEAMRRQGRHPSGNTTLARGIRYSKECGWYYDEAELAVVRLVFERFLAGEHNYHALSQLSGIPRSSIRVLLVNPVYAGLMTYSIKHDLGPNGAYPRKPDGRRAYRRKIERRAEEVIQVPLPLKPVITLDEHRYILSIVDGLRRPRVEARGQAEPRFTYRGFLRCGSCSDLVYSWTGGKLKNGAPKDFYYCKSKAPRERQKNRPCDNRYMTRSHLEIAIDDVIGRYLTQPDFLTTAIEEHLRYVQQSDTVSQAKAITDQLERLQAKERRVIDAYIDGNLDRVQKQIRLSEISNQVDELTRTLRQIRPATFDAAQIRDVVSVFAEWAFLAMTSKRRLLEKLIPEIRVYRYQVLGVTLRLKSSSTGNRLKTYGSVTTSETPDFTDIPISISAPISSALASDRGPRRAPGRNYTEAAG